MNKLNFHINALGFGFIDYFMVILFAVVTLWIALTKPSRIIYILPAACTFYFFIPFTTELTPYKIVPLVLIIVTTITGKRNYFSGSGNNWIIFMWLWVLVSFFWGFACAFGLDFFGHIHSPFKRFFIQIINYLNMVVIYLIAKKECSDKEKFYLFVKSYIFTTTILCLYGLFQIFAFKFGLPFRWVVYGTTQDLAQSMYDRLDPEEMIFRINSLAQEPKRLSYVLPISVFLIVGLRKVWGDEFMSKARARILIFLHIFCAFMTYSTSLYFAMAIFIPVTFLLGIFRKAQRNYTKVFTMGLIFLILSSPLYIDILMKIYDARVIAQLNGLNVIQWKKAEQFGIEAIQAKPWVVFTGTGLGGWNFFFYYAGLKGWFVFPRGFMHMNSGMMISMFDLGLIGLILINSHIVRVFLGYKKLKNPILREIYAPVILFFFCVALFLNTYTLYFLFIGIFDGIYQKDKNSRSNRLVSPRD